MFGFVAVTSIRGWNFSCLFGVFLLIAFASPAAAQVCVQLNSARDGLAEADQRSAVIVLEDSFATEGQEVVPAPCGEQYSLYHLKFGGAVIVAVSGPKGSRRLQVASLREVPGAYSRIVRSLLAGEELVVREAPSRDSIPEKEAKPNRERADSLIYGAIGTGDVVGGHENLVTGPQIALGYRHELDGYGMDLSLRVGGVSQDPDGPTEGLSPSDQRVERGGEGEMEEIPNLSDSFSLIVRGLYFPSQSASSSLYLAAGLGGSSISFLRHNHEWSGRGVIANTAVGYEWFRTSTLRLFVESSVILPFFTVDDDRGNSRWTPVTSIVLGGAWWSNRQGCCL